MLKLTYYGHATFLLDDGTTKLLIDPFLEGNPLAPIKPDAVNAQYIVVTHGHGDHLGDAIPIAKRCGATIIAVYELADFCAKQGATTHAMSIGGGHEFSFGKVKFTIAHHGSSFDGKYLGSPAGVLVTMGGTTTYHTGDTGLFYDMKLIGEMNPVDVLLVPIGDNYTMGIDDAVKAVELVNPKFVVPMHYNTFPAIKTDPNEFLKKVMTKGFQGKIMNAGDTIEL